MGEVRERVERTLAVTDLSLLDCLHVAVQVVDEVFALGVVHRLRPERARLLEVDCVTQNETSVSDQHRSDTIAPQRDVWYE